MLSQVRPGLVTLVQVRPVYDMFGQVGHFKQG